MIVVGLLQHRRMISAKSGDSHEEPKERSSLFARLMPKKKVLRSPKSLRPFREQPDVHAGRGSEGVRAAACSVL